MDWKKLLIDLADAGVTQEQIAAYCGCQQSAISFVKRGKTADPRSSIGLGLMRLALLHGITIDKAGEKVPA